MGHPAQYNGMPSHAQQHGSKYAGQPQHSQPPVGYTYETFQTPTSANYPPAGAMNSKSASIASTPAATPRNRDYVTDSDTAMEDADPYNRAKYSARPNPHSRASSQFLPSEESTAARRYSPMNNALSPSAPFNTSPGKASNSHGFLPAPGNARRSPTRALNYSTPPQAYQSPPCEFWRWTLSHLPSRGVVNLIFPHSRISPAATAASSIRPDESGAALPAVRWLVPTQSCVRTGLAVPPSSADPWPRSSAQVSEGQVGAGIAPSCQRAAAIPSCEP